MYNLQLFFSFLGIHRKILQITRCHNTSFFIMNTELHCTEIKQELDHEKQELSHEKQELENWTIKWPNLTRNA